MFLCDQLFVFIIYNGASKSYTISWVYHNLSNHVLNDSRDLAVIPVSGRTKVR